MSQVNHVPNMAMYMNKYNPKEYLHACTFAVIKLNVCFLIKLPIKKIQNGSRLEVDCVRGSHGNNNLKNTNTNSFI